MTYIIGEIGQNHNGSVDIAKLMIDTVVRPVVDERFQATLKPIDAIKLTKRDLAEELSESQMNRPYDSPHSFGKTYGEHRAHLELSDEQHYEIYQYARQSGLEFVETICAIGAMSLLKLFSPDRLKVASRDLTNLPLLAAMAETKLPIVLSTGMTGKKELDEALETITRYHSNISILHCVSEYPTAYENVNLRTIHYLQKHYSEYTIGYSDHTIGIAAPIAAVAMGAKVIEKHITLDRKMKGTDQEGSLAPEGIHRMVRDIRNMEKAMGVEDIVVPESVIGAKNKLERSLATRRAMKAGEVVEEKDIHLLSPGDGYRWSERDEVIGKKLTKDISGNEIIYPDYVL
ncbi:N-acetylneuraminate synthase family protein [Prolixibacter sp. NT017]|uniref:N-acetylneuraminate synthase family protein n=1 Tax=Prolixibacter sp. NT017 TaxID=2652390 RepID=UPI00127C13AD|nr:N-acetylneuraminate synthase family protein [Prolixibacter sp. NT017]GET27033.1 sialic acid synthase [Prolixibacter sp. NT017]